MNKIKLFIAEDHPIVLEGMVKLFENDTEFEVIGSASSCEQAAQDILKCEPDVILTDLRFPDGNAIDLHQKIQVQKGPIKTVCLTMHKEQGYVAKAYKAGIEAYLLKETGLKEVKGTLKGVMQGQQFYSPNLFYFQNKESANG